MKKLFRLERSILKVARPVAKKVTDLPLPPDRYFDERAVARAEARRRRRAPQGPRDDDRAARDERREDRHQGDAARLHVLRPLRLHGRRRDREPAPAGRRPGPVLLEMAEDPGRVPRGGAELLRPRPDLHAAAQGRPGPRFGGSPGARAGAVGREGSRRVLPLGSAVSLREAERKLRSHARPSVRRAGTKSTSRWRRETSSCASATCAITSRSRGCSRASRRPARRSRTASSRCASGRRPPRGTAREGSPRREREDVMRDEADSPRGNAGARRRRRAGRKSTARTPAAPPSKRNSDRAGAKSRRPRQRAEAVRSRASPARERAASSSPPRTSSASSRSVSRAGTGARSRAPRPRASSS